MSEKERVVLVDRREVKSEIVGEAEGEGEVAEEVEREEEVLVVQEKEKTLSSNLAASGEGGEEVDFNLILSQILSGCSCVDVHHLQINPIPFSREEGLIHKCVKSYSGETKQVY
jgi:hypothetical protein